MFYPNLFSISISKESISLSYSVSSFLKKAPQNVIDQFKNQENEIKSSIEKIEQIIDTIN